MHPILIILIIYWLLFIDIKIINVNVKTVWTAVCVTWNLNISDIETNFGLQMKYQLEYRVQGSNQWIIACNNTSDTECYFEIRYSMLNKNFAYKIIGKNQLKPIQVISYNDTHKLG